MKEIKLKLLTPNEVAEVVSLDRICLGGLWKEEAYLREIDSDKSTLIALHLSDAEKRDRSKIIGMGCLWSIVEEAHITLLGIHPNYRRQGFGQLLLLNLLEDAVVRKLEWATLEVNVNNTSAINLYKKFGFQTIGKRKGYYQATGEDASVLWLKGIQGSEFESSLSQWQKKLVSQLRKNCYKLG